MMKKCLATAAAAFLMFMGTAGAAGVVEGVVKVPLNLGFEPIGSKGGSGGAEGFGIAINGAKKKVDKSVQLQLISRMADYSRLSDNALEAWYKDGVAPENVSVFIVKSEEDGKYAFTDVPAGSYYLVIVTPGLAKSAPVQSRIAQDLSKRLRNWEMFELFTLGMHDYTVQPVEVKDDTVTHFDYDFSAPPFAGK